MRAECKYRVIPIRKQQVSRGDAEAAERTAEPRPASSHRNRMKRIFRLLTAALLFAAACSPADGGGLQDYDGSTFQPGQVWSYRARPGESGSRLTVLKVERHPELGTIVHVSITGLEIRNALEPGSHISQIAHLPFSEEALLRSVRAKLRDGAPTDAGDAGYRAWRRALDRGEGGGVFTVGVAESIGVAEEVIGKGAAR